MEIAEGAASSPSATAVASSPSPAAAAAAGAATSYTFEPEQRALASLAPGSATAASLRKWGLAPRLSAACVRIAGRRFDESESAAFLRDLVASAALRAQLQLFDRAGAPRPLAAAGPAAAAAAAGAAPALRFERLNVRATSMAFFDRLQAAGAVTDAGYIRKRQEEDFEGVAVCDLLREALLCPDAPFAAGGFEGLFSGAERDELLFRLLRLVAAGGGALCQHEDAWGAYLEAARALYRDLVAVTKDAEGVVSVASHVFAVSGAGLFPNDSPHSACFVCVDPMRRTATVLASTFIAGW